MDKKIVIALFVCFLLINTVYVEAFSFSDIFDAINNFFDRIFGREKIVGIQNCNCNPDDPPINCGTCVPEGCSPPSPNPEGLTGHCTTLTPQCNDAIDNDGDGKIDYGTGINNDPGCSSLTDNNERGNLLCDNGLDDDNDGYCDKNGCIISGQQLSLDPGCSSLTDNSEKGNFICDNGLDDDSDGKIDWCKSANSPVNCDPDCISVVASTELTMGGGGGMIDCSSTPLTPYAISKICANSYVCQSNQTDQACCNQNDDCIYNGQCYDNIVDTSLLCSNSNGCLDMNDLSNDLEICIHTQGEGYDSWYDADTSQLVCSKVNGHWMTVGTNSGKCQQTNRWSSNNYCNDATPSTQLNTGQSYCCGDDVSEYYTESNGKTACCGSSGLNINNVGECASTIEICNNGINDDQDTYTDCYDLDDCPANQNLGGYMCDANKVLHEANFTDSVDNDNDGVKDKLDKDCKISPYGSSSNLCNDLSISNLVVQGNKKEFYIYSEIPYINCNYNEALSEGDSNSIIECIDLNVSNIPCTNKQYYSNYIKFTDCYVGETLGDANINCYVDSKCSSQIPTSYLYGINVTEFEICNSNSNIKGDIGEGNFSIFEISGILDEYELGDKIDIDVEVGNQQDNGQSMEVKTESWLVQINNGLKKASIESNYEEIEHLESKMFELNLTIPIDLSLNQTYRLYVKAFKKNNENKMCISNSEALNLLEGGCVDEDNDGYTDNSCGGSDCDDTNNNIHPGATEVCSDSIDNDCDGFTDFADPDCQQPQTCQPSWNCSPWEPSNEECEIGETQTRTCLDGNQCGTNLTKPTETQSCGQSYAGGVDSDNDGLPDEWELAYFGNLAQGPNDDYDGDGMTNAQEWASNTNPKVSDKLKEGSSLLTVLIVALIIIVIGVVAVILYFKFVKKIEKGKTFISNEDKLVDYIKKCRQRGLSDDVIKQELLKAGWKKEDISKYL